MARMKTRPVTSAEPCTPAAATLPGGKKAIRVAIGIFVVLLLGYRLFFYRQPAPVISVKKVEVEGKVHGPLTPPRPSLR